jgi:hypothetical protein
MTFMTFIIEIAMEIMEQYVMPAKIFNSQKCCEPTLKKYHDITGNSDGFSSHCFHWRYRSRQIGRAEIEEWRNAMIAFLDSAEHHRIINCDETAWKVIPSGLLTWTPVGHFPDAAAFLQDACVSLETRIIENG